MHQINKAHPVVRIGIEPNHDEARKESFDPRPSTYRNGTGRPGARLRIVPASGGFAFVEDKPAIERS